MIDHVIVLFGFCHRLGHVRLVMESQICFRHSPHLYNQSCNCPIWFSSQSVLDLIGHDCSISFSTQTVTVRSVTTVQFSFQRRSHLYNESHSYPIWFLSQSTLDSISHDSSVSFSTQTLHDRSSRGLIQFSHRLHLVKQVLVVQFWFRRRLHLCDLSCHCSIQFSLKIEADPIDHGSLVFFFRHKLHLYDQSCHCPIWFLSQSTPSPISHNILVLFLTQTASI